MMKDKRGVLNMTMNERINYEDDRDGERDKMKELM